jgi:hypothetical protein
MTGSFFVQPAFSNLHTQLIIRLLYFKELFIPLHPRRKNSGDMLNT